MCNVVQSQTYYLDLSSSYVSVCHIYKILHQSCLKIENDIVDNAYNCDPRIQRFKEEEKQKKLAQKKAKQDAARAKAELEEKVKYKICSIRQTFTKQQQHFVTF